MKSLWLIPLVLLCGCNRIHRVQTYQERATKACELHHSAEECKPLPYPSEQR